MRSLLLRVGCFVIAALLGFAAVALVAGFILGIAHALGLDTPRELADAVLVVAVAYVVVSSCRSGH